MKRLSIKKIVIGGAVLIGLLLGGSGFMGTAPSPPSGRTAFTQNDPVVLSKRKSRRQRMARAKRARLGSSPVFTNPAGVSNDSNGRLYFGAESSSNGSQLYSYDLNAGTAQQIIVNPAGSARLGSTASDSGGCYFSAYRPPIGQELFHYDPATGQVQSFDLIPGEQGSFPTSLTLAGTNLYFNAYTLGSGYELYRLNTLTGQWKSYDLNSSPVCTDPMGIAVGPAGNPFFSGYYPGWGQELGFFRGDNETSGFFDIFAGPGSSWPASPVFDPNGNLAFGATLDTSAGQELVVGNPASPGFPGNATVFDVNPGTASSDPNHIQFDAFGRVIFSGTSSAASGPEVHVLDPNSPSPVASMQVVEINFGSEGADIDIIDSQFPQGFALNAVTPTYGNELYFVPREYPWDPLPTGALPPYGTPQLYADIFPGSGSSNPSDLTLANGTYYFVAGESAGLRNLWTGWIDGLDVTSPNGGEIWHTGSSHPIAWTALGQVSNVRIEYSTDDGVTWTSITGSTPNTGTFPWTVPSTPSSKCLVQVSDANAPDDVYGVSDQVWSIFTGTAPRIQVSRDNLNFGAPAGTVGVHPQTFVVTNSGGGVLSWTASASPDSIGFSPHSGTAGTTVTVTPDVSSLAPGAYIGAITITDPNAVNPHQFVSVHINVFGPGQTAAPFGSFDSPLTGATVMSSVPVTGWALDEVGLEGVKIYRHPVISDPPGAIGANGLVYVGDAFFVEGARPDVEQTYPGFPNNDRAGWGYMMLTYGLPGGGNGPFTLVAIARDLEGRETVLGTKSIVADNAHSVKPFGAIDTPDPGGTASGPQFRNWGWALTPLPNTIPQDGSTIGVFVDGVRLGHPVYNLHRSDVASLFPGYSNSGGAAGYFDLNTQGYATGLHTIAWTVADAAGNSDGIGSRYFTILNTSPGPSLEFGPRLTRLSQLTGVPVLSAVPSRFRRGFDPSRRPDTGFPGPSGAAEIPLRELELLEIDLNASLPAREAHGETSAGLYSGYVIVGKELRPLPVGSTLRSEAGMFSWLPGPGFIGDYDFVFLYETEGRIRGQIRLRVRIDPKQ